MGFILGFLILLSAALLLVAGVFIACYIHDGLK